MPKTTVLIVDDSALIRKLLTEILNSDPEIEVVGTALDPYIARDKIKKLRPDVLTLDVEMPRMDGITFLKNLMRLNPLPVVMISSLTEQGAKVTLQALEYGALDFIAKPKLDVLQELSSYRDDICDKVKAAARVNVEALIIDRTPASPSMVSRALDVPEKLSADVILPQQVANAIPSHLKITEKIIAIGSSTGGTEAIKAIFTALPADCPAIVVSQHIPVTFSKPFAERLDALSQIKVLQAEDGQQILPGHAYIAPGDRHLLVRRSGARFYCELNDGPAVSRHKPSVDVMFRSVAQNVGSNAIGIMLTGMGDDGARGMLEMKEAGAYNFVQDESSSVVWGMPGKAVSFGATDIQVPLNEIAEKIKSLTMVR